MKTAKLLLFLLIPASLHGAITPVGPVNFGKGLNLQANPTAIDDAQSPDMCNLCSNTDGSASKIWGSERYIEQARSTGPVPALYRAYASAGTTTVKVTLAVIGNEIVYSTSDKNGSWIRLSSAIQPNQNWSFTSNNDSVIFTGDKLVDPVKKFNVFTKELTDLFSTIQTTDSINIKAKYVLQKSNYFFYLNCSSGTKYFPSRVYYTILNSPSSTTVSRFFDVRPGDGEELTGGGVMLDKVNFFKPSSVHELSFTILNLASADPARDQELAELVSGFGLKAPRVLENIGLYYVVGSQDSIRLYDGGRRVQLTVSDGSAPISTNIKTLIDRLIKAKTYERMVCKYYKKRNWLMFSYEDPDKFPRGRNNSVIFYDLMNKEWYPICGWLADSFETFDGLGDSGDLIYGDSSDGFVYYADREQAIDNAPKNLVVDTMDSSSGWSGATNDFDNVIEGTGSLRMWVNPAVLTSSITSIKVMSIGEYPDKTQVNKSTHSGFSGDKLSFKYFTTYSSNVTSLRVDLEINDISGTVFDQNFTSVTLTSGTLNASNNSWKTVEIDLSSFPVLSEWISLDSETFPFAKSLYYFGIRFSLTGVDVSSVSIDDIRVVQKRNPLNFYRFTKLYDFGSVAQKIMGQVIVTTDRQRDSTLNVDIYNDFGKKVTTKKLNSEIPREIIVLGFTSTASIDVIDDLDFSVKRSTVYASSVTWPLNGVVSNGFIYFPNRVDNSLTKIDRNGFVFISSYGSFGLGTTNYNIAHQMDIDENGRLNIVDLGNNRIMVNSEDDLSFILTVGTLGMTTDDFHVPTGITCDASNCYVSDEGNDRWMKFTASTLGYVSQVSIGYNAIGDTSLDQDESRLYGAYNKISDETLGYQDVILESRSKGDDMGLINRIKIYPNDTVTLSTYALTGDIAIRGRYIYVSFTDNETNLSSARYYIQKRLRSDFSLVKEYVTVAGKRLFSVLGDAHSHKPAMRSERVNLETEGRYIQLKFYDTDDDNSVSLVNQTFLIEPQTITY